MAPALLLPRHHRRANARQPLATLRRSGPRGDASTPTPQLTVVIVNFCQWDNTARLVDQLLSADCARAGAAEIVIVDNHSPLSLHARRLRRTPGVLVRRFSRNRGFARAVNTGCRLGRGGWILLLNPDVTVEPDFLDDVLARVRGLSAEEPRAGVMGFALKNSDGTPQGSWGPLPTFTSTLLGMIRRRDRRKCRPCESVTRREVPWVTGCCLLVRRDCWRDLSGFDEDFFLYYEDVDLCRRANAAGWSVWYEPGLHVMHHFPLHARQVPPALRLVTRHALLTYASKHWPAWQTQVLGRIVRLEARLRAAAAGWRGDGEAAHLFADMAGMAQELPRGQGMRARARVLRAARLLERGTETATLPPVAVTAEPRHAGAG